MPTNSRQLLRLRVKTLYRVEATILHYWKPVSLSVASARTSSQRWRPDLEDRAKTKSICNGLHRILSAPLAHSNWLLVRRGLLGLLGLSGKVRTPPAVDQSSLTHSSADRKIILCAPKLRHIFSHAFTPCSSAFHQVWRWGPVRVKRSTDLGGGSWWLHEPVGLDLGVPGC